ncbi:MAG TPA: histidine phosphatase family protein [Flavobacterium sp.]|jgi:phosphohistidine phosphatase|uniref:SixA phosphatase family protein n=1 Tax=Flavobacterium sp. TaxID=239 RepID=UPI002C3975E1|nr:histidine phosphatase family protein [Flavobacterium sp.]MCA0350118.1 histidine phosphatase family protein [Bacteroidota bacterium]HPW98571.1 histidine phosphatase family protein [Flavobacterium sp.]HQA75216.1 histidine phosphatase family protein [Flavobacterium sp.]
MKQLILVRHAKSSWDLPVQDFDRPLSNRGIQDAHLISSKVINYLPETFIIWSSAAKRAMETAIIFTQNFSCPIESIIFKKELYTFDLTKLETIIKNCNDQFDNLILFGHNEAITHFVNKFGNVTVDNVSTSGFVSITFETNSWKAISNGKTNKIILPKDFN